MQELGRGASREGGAESLLTRGIINPHSDVTPLFNRQEQASLKTKPMRMRPRYEAYFRMDMTMEPSLSGIVKPGLRLDPHAFAPLPSIPPTVMGEEEVSPPRPLPTRNTSIKGSVEAIHPDGWVVSVVNGEVYVNSPTYCKFIERARKERIDSVCYYILDHLSALIRGWGLKYCEIMCEAIFLLAKDPFIYPIRHERLLECLSNKEKVLILI